MWTTLKLDPKLLVHARLLVHWASQLPAAAGAALVPRRSDDSHTSLHWEPECRALVGEELGPGAFRVGLRVNDLTLLVLEENRVHSALSLLGKALTPALGELGTRLGSALDRELPKLALLGHELPSHPVGSTASFERSGLEDALEELQHWIENAHDLLTSFVQGNDQASPVRLWPHHFDMASLITADLGAYPEHAKSVNVGLSLGDTSYPEPYLYVSPWPYPENRDEAPPLGHGSWHSDGFFAAVYKGSDLLTGDPRGQAERASAFLRQAHELSRALLGLPED